MVDKVLLTYPVIGFPAETPLDEVPQFAVSNMVDKGVEFLPKLLL